jgi:hypothetical protein
MHPDNSFVFPVFSSSCRRVLTRPPFVFPFFPSLSPPNIPLKRPSPSVILLCIVILHVYPAIPSNSQTHPQSSAFALSFGHWARPPAFSSSTCFALLPRLHVSSPDVVQRGLACPTRPTAPPSTPPFFTRPRLASFLALIPAALRPSPDKDAFSAQRHMLTELAAPPSNPSSSLLF